MDFHTEFKCLMTPCELSEKPAHEGLLSIIGGVLVRSVPSPVNTVRDRGTSDENFVLNLNSDAKLNVLLSSTGGRVRGPKRAV